MPVPRPGLDAAAARDHIERCGFTATNDERVGIEVELLTNPQNSRHHLQAEPVLPAGGRLTYEPGGQIEVSSQPHATVTDACAAMALDLAAAKAAAAAEGLTVAEAALDCHPRPMRTDGARYRAMLEYFARRGEPGPSMMCQSASVQVNVDGGTTDDHDRRWQRLHTLGPALVAAFANSPDEDGWRSGRMRIWMALDDTRTSPVSGPRAAMDKPARQAWADYAMDANVMLIVTDDERCVAVGEDMPFSRWVAEGHQLGFPDVGDLDRHLTTLFPPVRARGWFEVRMVDALPDPWWRVPAAVVVALTYDDDAGEDAADAAAGCADSWEAAARLGLDDPVLADAALVCMDRALAVLPSVGADDALCDTVAEYRHRYTARRRTPADERMAIR